MELVKASIPAVPQDGKIAWIKQPNYDTIFRFEWHPLTKTVFVIHLDDPARALNPIGLNINVLGDGINAVLIYLRGYQEGVRRSKPKLIGG